MNTHRDHHVAGVASEWAQFTHRFSPLVESMPRPRPMAVRRTVHTRQVEALKARWFAFGAASAIAPLAIAWGLVHLIGA
jgi:hypothetical protein